MKPRTALIMMITLLLLVLPYNSAFGQPPPPGPVVRYQFRAEGLPQTAPFNVVQNRMHFEPGAATPVHTHPGQVFITVLEGELTLRVQGAEKVYKAGESFIEVPNEVYQTRNAGTSRTSVMATYLLPKDAPLLHPVPGDTTPPPRPFVSYQFKTDVQPMPEPFDVVQLVQDFAPGAATPFHTHPGIVVVTVLEGENTFSVNGVEKVYKAGESFVEVPGEVYQARNATTAPMSVMASFLIPKGAPLLMAHPAPTAPATLPRTGTADPRAPSDWLLIVAVIGLIAGGWLLRRQRHQHD